jgi:2',3'-cyclic-nucleotide 2'-phosphodiesterase (5'-nucleotidase family)
MAGGGDGYTAFQSGTNVVQPGETLLQVLVDYVTANSPVSAAVEGRITFAQ